MKRVILLITMLFVALMGVAKAEVIQIGSGNYTGYELPVNTYYNYSLTQQIYTADEIGRSGFITDLSFYYAYSNAFNMEGVKVYLFHTNKNSFSSNTDMISVSTPSNLYFEGTFSASVSGWVTLTLDRPFNYNGTSNLVVCFYDPTSGYPGSEYVFRRTSTSDSKSISYYSDGVCPDLSNLQNYSGSKAVYSARSNIRFHFYDPETQPYETTIQMGFESEQSYQLPVNMYYHYSMTQQIYQAAQIGSRGTIYTIGFDYAYTGSFSMEGIKVYMKNVRRQYFNTTSDYVEVAESDKVFEGTFSATGPGWVTLTLDTPFEYDGTSNLLVCFLDQTGGYPGNSYKFNCSTATSSSLIYYDDSNSNIPNLSNLSGYNGYKAVLDLRTNIRLGFTSGSFLQIGEGTDSGYYLPTTTYYHYSLTQQIFTANEIGTSGTIHSLSFQYAHTAPFIMTGLQVYLKHVDKTTFQNNNDMVSISASDLVYQGTLAASGSGWTTLTLDTPFDYDGTSNLLVCVYDPNYGYPGSAYKFYYTATTNNPSIVYYSDAYVPDITDVSSFSGSKTRPKYRSNIRFGITPTVNIGTGTTEEYRVPFNSYYNYSFVEQIYTADEIGTEGRINSIGFYMTSSAPQTNSVTVYMKHVSRNSFTNTSDYESVSPTDIVFEGNWTLNQGWTTITLDNPFEYDGTHNLLIAIDENTNAYSKRYFYRSEKAGAALGYYSDDSNPNPYDLSSFNGNKDLYNYHANLQLDILPFGEDYCPKPQNLRVSVQPNAIVMDWDTEGDSWLVFWKAATGTTPASGQWGAWVDPPLTITQYKPYGGNWTNLEPGATYEYMIAVQCSDGSDSQYTPLAQVTLPEESSFPIDFETGYLNQFPFNNSVSEYPWMVTNSDAASGTYCMMSSNQGVNSSTSAIEAMYFFEEDGYVAFDAKCMGESGDYIYDACEFFIDDEAQFSYGDQGNTWNLYAYTVTAGTHTFRWKYSKDSSVNPEGDTFYVDNLIFGLGAPCFAPTLVRTMDLTLSSATMEWDGFASSFKLRYRLVGGSWTTKSNLTGNTYTINNLAPGNYQVQVWATCDESHKVSTNFTITEVLSTAEWYGYAIAASSGLKYKYVQFTMQNPGTLTAVSDSYSLLIDQGTFANGFVWGIDGSRRLVRAPFDMTSHTVGTFEVLATAFDTELTGLGSMSYNPVDGRMYYTIDNVSNTYLKSFDPDNISDRITIGEIAFGCEFTINQEGTAYCIGYDNNLYTVNLNNASTTLVGNLGISFGMRPTWQTSMAFDMETGELFWIKYYSATQNGAYKINTSTGVATYIRHLGAQINGLFMVPPMNEAPVEADFETGDLSQLIFNNSVSSYPWEVTNSDAASGSYCMRSTNQGVASSTSAIEATCHFSEDGYVAFDAKCMGESTTYGSIVAVWDGCRFYIDNVAQFSYGDHGNKWDLYVFEVTAGIHTFRWEYHKDDETDPDGDTFYVDNLNFGIGSPCFAPTYVMLTNASLSSATLKWDGVASTYKLRYKKVGGSWTTKSNLTGNTYTINNLAPGNYQAQVWATCDESHKVSTNFTITQVLSTAEWYGYAVEAFGGEDWEKKFVQFSVQNPGTVTAASSTIETYLLAATYANGVVWGFTQNGELFRAPFNYDTHTIGNMEILVTGFESSCVGDMSYNPIDGKIYFVYYSYDNSNECLMCFDPNHYATITTIGEFDFGLFRFIHLFAINKYGAGYLIGPDSNLYTVDLIDASLSLVGPTMQKAKESLQSMAFDMETDELIWAQQWSQYENALYKVDTETGFATSIGVLGSNGAIITGLFMLPNADEQTIELENGWKWISSYVTYDGNSLSNLENTISTSAVNAATIKSQTNYRTYESGSWYGNMSGLVNENMYMVQLDRNLTVTFSGPVINPAEHPLTLSKGWKWISFLSPTTMSLENALANLNSQADDVIKGQGGFSTYSGTAWVGSLKNLEPGRGYMYENNSNTVKTFTYPSAGKGFVTEETAETFWKSDIHAFAHNLCMMVSVEDLALSEGSHEIGAFVNGECRGSARIQTVEGFDTPMAFLTVTGTEGETVSFKVLDAHTGMEMGNAVERIPFTNDAVYGRLSQPYLLHLDANGVDSHHDEVSLFPNPTKDKVRLQASDIQMVKLFNAMGQCLYSEEFDHATEVELDLSAFSAGVYTLSVRTCNGKTANRKVVKD